MNELTLTVFSICQACRQSTRYRGDLNWSHHQSPAQVASDGYIYLCFTYTTSYRWAIRSSMTRICSRLHQVQDLSLTCKSGWMDPGPVSGGDSCIWRRSQSPIAKRRDSRLDSKMAELFSPLVHNKHIIMLSPLALTRWIKIMCIRQPLPNCHRFTPQRKSVAYISAVQQHRYTFTELDLGWGPGSPVLRPHTNTGPPTKPFKTRTYRTILDYSELSNPIQCVLTGAGSPLCR